MWILQLLLIIVLSFGVSLVTQVIYKKFANQEELLEIKNKMKELQKDIKNKKNPQEALDTQTQIMDLTSKKFKLTMKPMIISMVLFFITFPFLKNIFNGFVLVEFPFSLILTDGTIGWLWTYVIFSMIFSPVLQKILKVNM